MKHYKEALARNDQMALNFQQGQKDAREILANFGVYPEDNSEEMAAILYYSNLLVLQAIEQNHQFF